MNFFPANDLLELNPKPAGGRDQEILDRTEETKPEQAVDPTGICYDTLIYAYGVLKQKLFCDFCDSLPDCMITLQHDRHAYGHFVGKKYGTRDGRVITDEIALTPSHFRGRTTEQILSTLAHEMMHLWQHHFGKPGRRGYHNREFANRLRSIGLMPSATGKTGGAEIGESMSHYIMTGGRFDLVCQQLIAEGFTIPYVELLQGHQDEAEITAAAKKAASKTSFFCPICNTEHVWGKETTFVLCGPCWKQRQKVVPLETGSPARNRRDTPKSRLSGPPPA